ncbi:MAG: uracil-DNA glycosylase family protein [Chitinophagaceae bacterium]
MHFSEHILAFISSLKFPVKLTPGTEVMNPFLDDATMEICTRFYRKFYSDEELRWVIIGINPGRFGGGVTGIPFTDPIRLQRDCELVNEWPKKQELSSVFMYQMIEAFGGPVAFYKKFYITAVSPLGFTRNNKNLNYYDDLNLQLSIKDFVVDCFSRQLAFGIHRNAAFCLGDGKNFKYLSALNKEYHFFETIIPLSHPRFIMQYRLRKKEEYIKFYCEIFNQYTF